MTVESVMSTVTELLRKAGRSVEADGATLLVAVSNVAETSVTLDEEADSAGDARFFHAQVLTAVDASRGINDLPLLAALNRLAAISAVVRDEQTSELWLSTGLRWSHQVAEHPMAVLVAAGALFQSPILSETLKVASTSRCDALDFPKRDEAPPGLSEDFTRAVAILENAHVLAFADADGLTAELAWEKGALSSSAGHKTSLLQLDGSQSHPVVGHGLAYRLTMHPVFDSATAFALANTLNDFEMKHRLPPCPGAWSGADGTLVFSGVIPTFVCARGMATLVVDWLRRKHDSAAFFVKRVGS